MSCTYSDWGITFTFGLNAAVWVKSAKKAHTAHENDRTDLLRCFILQLGEATQNSKEYTLKVSGGEGVKVDSASVQVWRKIRVRVRNGGEVRKWEK